LAARDDDRPSEDITLEVKVPAQVRPSRTTFALHVVKGPRAGEIFIVDRSHAVLGRGGDADLRIPDPSLSRVHARFDREGDTLALTDIDSRNGTFVEGKRLTDRHTLHSGDLITLGNVVLRFAIEDATAVKASRDLYEAAVRDRLTGMHNRGYFDDRLAAEFAFARRHNSPLSVLLLDLDNFKQVNDVHGHPTGDAVLKAAALKIAQTVRAEDVAARYGGEEFAVLARGSDHDGAQVLGQRLRTRIQVTDVPTAQGGHLRVTTSVGIAVLRKDAAYKTPADLVAAADEALYMAKRNGTRSSPKRSASRASSRAPRARRSPDALTGRS
jgi:diguanylate cyclase (GGDEF)-like protein